MKRILEWLARFFSFRKKEWKPPLRKDFKEYVKSQNLDTLRGPARRAAMARIVKNRRMFE